MKRMTFVAAVLVALFVGLVITRAQGPQMRAQSIVTSNGTRVANQVR